MTQMHRFRSVSDVAKQCNRIPGPEASSRVAYLHDRRPEVDGLRTNGAVPELSELALGRTLDIRRVLSGALVGATLREAHVGVDLAGRHLGAEGPDTEAGGHSGGVDLVFRRCEESSGRRGV